MNAFIWIARIWPLHTNDIDVPVHVVVEFFYLPYILQVIQFIMYIFKLLHYLVARMPPKGMSKNS